jgi:tRNA(Ile2) C34 agmatinyltransferase TiaS
MTKTICPDCGSDDTTMHRMFEYWCECCGLIFWRTMAELVNELPREIGGLDLS